MQTSCKDRPSDVHFGVTRVVKLSADEMPFYLKALFSSDQCNSANIYLVLILGWALCWYRATQQGFRYSPGPPETPTAFEIGPNSMGRHLGLKKNCHQFEKLTF